MATLTVHTDGKWDIKQSEGLSIEEIGGRIEPEIVPSLAKQQRAAVANPQRFDEQVERVARIYREHCRRIPSYKLTLCKRIVQGEPCPYGHHCTFAHTLIAQFGAKKAIGNPRFKTKPCQYKKCKHGAGCNAVHPGDLRRIVDSELKTIGYVIQR